MLGRIDGIGAVGDDYGRPLGKLMPVVIICMEALRLTYTPIAPFFRMP